MVSQKTILRSDQASPRLPTTDLFLVVITSATEVGNTRPTADAPESIARIHEVNFYCLTSSVWDDLSLVGDALPSPSYAEQVDVMALRDPHDTYQNSAQPQQPPPVFEHPCSALKKILSSGSFYYAISPHWDISSRLAERLSRDRSEAHDLGAFDERFVWNEYIVRSLLDFRERLDLKEREDLDKCQFIVSLLLLQPRLVSAALRGSSIGPCHTRLRRRVYDPAPGASNEWCSDHRDSQSNLPPGGKACWDALQHARRR